MIIFYAILIIFSVFGLVSVLSNIINKILNYKNSYKSYLLIKIENVDDIDLELKLLILKLNWLNLQSIENIIILNENSKLDNALTEFCNTYKLKYITNINEI